MSITFNADEIFEMAEEIERNGAGFYRQAADIAKDAKIKKLLLDMAAMEQNHLAAFQQMRKTLLGQEMAKNIFDPDNESALYLQSMADSHGWEGKKTATEPLTGDETMEDILKTAISAEKNSVIFYVSLKGLVPPRAGRDRVDAVIEEEIGHINILKKQLAALKR